MAAVIEIPKEVIKEEDRESGVYRFNVQQYGRMLEAGVICEDDRLELIEGRHYSILSVEPSIMRTGGLSGSFGKRVSKENDL